MNTTKWALLTIAGVIAVPILASALSVSDLQAQVQALQAQLFSGQGTATATVVAPTISAKICSAMPARSLSTGVRGSDVENLQEFLQAEGYFNASATGYFGPVTAHALAQWQTSQGVSAIGVAGPATRARIQLLCGGGQTQSFTASPTSGTAPLNVTFTTSMGINEQAPYVDFGDGQQSPMTQGSCIGIAAIQGGQGGIRCSYSVSHTYTSNGTFSATLYKLNIGMGTCMIGNPNCNRTVLGSTTIVVGDSVNQSGTFSASPTSGGAPLPVDFTYTPTTDDSTQYYITYGDGSSDIMSRVQIYCIKAPCISPSKASHTYTQNGTYTAVVTRYIACMFTNPRCMIATIPLGQVTITVGGSSFGGAPSISSFSGPTTLPVNVSGTWSIQASDPQSGTLSYHVTWGDEQYLPYATAASMAANPFVQTTTFTHAYSNAGTYTVNVTVQNSAGFQSSASASVQVGATGVMCTADAMQCPDGHYVGRTGPNCQFVCN